MAQKSATMKARSLDKNEVMLLLDFIVKHEVITTKATNATNNKLKEEAWKVISQDFSAHLGESRRPEQLRLKWENLKKAARKRSASIRQNNLKTGGGKSFIGPDEVLDRVASMLGSTCNGFTVEFGGDSEHPEPSPMEGAKVILPDAVFIMGEGSTESGGGGGSGDGSGVIIEETLTELTPKKFLFNTPKNTRNKRRKLTEELHKAQIEKELMLVAYFRAKTEKIELENIKLKYEINKLQNNKD